MRTFITIPTEQGKASVDPYMVSAIVDRGQDECWVIVPGRTLEATRGKPWIMKLLGLNDGVAEETGPAPMITPKMTVFKPR